MNGSFGPMKLDFSSFYKFVASVGLVLVAASVLLPWFVLRTFVPEAPAGTPAARVVNVALDERADQYLFIVRMYPWASLVLFLLGCVLTGYGLVAWRARQKMQDADEDEAYRQRRELGQTTRASEGDREEKLDREALDGGGPEHDAAAQATRTSPDESHTTQPKVVSNPGDERYRARRDFIREAEERVGDLLRTAFYDSHTVEAGVRVGGSDSPIVDLVARAKDPSRWSSFAMEIKLLTSSGISQMRLRESMLAVAIAARDVPEGQVQVQRVGRPPVAKSVSLCLLIVADEEVSTGQSRLISPQLSISEFAKRTTRLVRIVNTVLSRQVGIILVPQSQFVDISASWLRQSVLDAMQHPEDPVLREQ